MDVKSWIKIWALAGLITIGITNTLNAAASDEEATTSGAITVFESTSGHDDNDEDSDIKAEESYDYELIAQRLSEVGVFKGSNLGFELDREATRIEALVLLIRMLGKEDEAALLASDPCIFEDVPGWATGYANYAYRHGLTNGIGNNLFGASDITTYQQFLTFMLRSLGYDDSQGDFYWADADTFSIENNIITEEFKLVMETEFKRSQVAKVLYHTLHASLSSGETTLVNYLIDQGSIETNGLARLVLSRDEDGVEESQESLDLNQSYTNIDHKTGESEEDLEEESTDTNSNLTHVQIETKIVDDEDDSEEVNEDEEVQSLTQEEIDMGMIDVHTLLRSETLYTREQVKAWARSKDMVQDGIDLVDIYFDICEEIGLNPVIEYVQMCYETGWLYKIPSTAGLTVDFHNPCGMKTTVGGGTFETTAYIRFESWEQGVRAHVDHTALYAGLSGYPKAVTDDPRHFSYLFGIADTIKEMAVRWAPPTPEYADKIVKLYNEIARY